jgi:hypothetical protein
MKKHWKVVWHSKDGKGNCLDLHGYKLLEGRRQFFYALIDFSTISINHKKKSPSFFIRWKCILMLYIFGSNYRKVEARVVL